MHQPSSDWLTECFLQSKTISRNIILCMFPIQYYWIHVAIESTLSMLLHIEVLHTFVMHLQPYSVATRPVSTYIYVHILFVNKYLCSQSASTRLSKQLPALFTKVNLHKYASVWYVYCPLSHTYFYRWPHSHPKTTALLGVILSLCLLVWTPDYLSHVALSS